MSGFQVLPEMALLHLSRLVAAVPSSTSASVGEIALEVTLLSHYTSVFSLKLFICNIPFL